MQTAIQAKGKPEVALEPKLWCIMRDKRPKVRARGRDEKL